MAKVIPPMDEPITYETFDDSPVQVTMEVVFTVHNPALLIAEWASKVPHAKDVLYQEREHPLNWASCILDLMTTSLDEDATGVEFSASTCGANPLLRMIGMNESDEEVFNGAVNLDDYEVPRSCR